MSIATVLCVIFHLHHVHVLPFNIKKSNHVETLSLNFLIMTAVANLLKAIVIDEGFIPEGNLLSFFEAIELSEKLTVLVLLGFIILIEIRKRINIKGRKNHNPDQLGVA